MKNKIIYISIIVVVVLIVGGIFTYNYFESKNNSKNNNISEINITNTDNSLGSGRHGD